MLAAAPAGLARAMTEQALVPTPGGADETLDPRDWEELRSLGHRMLDDMLDYLRDVRGDRPGNRRRQPRAR